MNFTNWQDDFGIHDETTQKFLDLFQLCTANPDGNPQLQVLVDRLVDLVADGETPELQQVQANKALIAAFGMDPVAIMNSWTVEGD